uniref:non-specific serine/threonine protein kinase n=1 Tax=viral metagenome TaxID=1070528 RepID=A0A6C0ENX0_9ZZZZ
MVLSGKMYIKQVPANQVDSEVELQLIAAKYGFAPKISNIEYGEYTCQIIMEDVEADCLANTYGDDPEEIPLWIWDQIRTMVTTLYEHEGIEYIDITPYNFIEKDNRIYMIDFGDAQYVNHDIPTNWFLSEFMDGENYWNPDYK